MGDFIVFLAQALGATAAWLNRKSPVAWPLALLLLFPFVAATLSLWIWWLRGRVWPVNCGYRTVRGHPCRRSVAGEWGRCHDHRRSWQRRTDRHRIDPSLGRWEQQNLGGAGFLRASSDVNSILYIRGFARPPRAVLSSMPTLLRGALLRMRLLVASLGQLTVRRSVPDDRSYGASPVLPFVVRATRCSLALVATGLFLVGTSLIGGAWRSWLEYGAATAFMGMWAVLRAGIAELRTDWVRVARSQTAKWAFSFFLFSVVLGGLLAGARPTQAVPQVAPPPQAPTTTTRTEFDGGLVVQVASDSSEGAAQRRAEDLQALGLPAATLVSDDFSSPQGPLVPGYHVTFVGPYENTEQGRLQAGDALLKLRNDYPDAYLRVVSRSAS